MKNIEELGEKKVIEILYPILKKLSEEIIEIKALLLDLKAFEDMNKEL